MRHIPNAITLLNLLLGCAALVAALTGHPAVAAWIILLCSLLDFLDGLAARLLHAGSPLGMQLDSMADLVSFGLAPSALVFHYLQGSVASMGGGSLLSLLPYTAFFLACASAWRLARFNTATPGSDGFVGLPTPASALFFVSLPLSMAYPSAGGWGMAIPDLLSGSFWALWLTTMAFTMMLVSPLRTFSLKLRSLRVREHPVQAVFALGSLLLLMLLRMQALHWIILYYLLLSAVTHVLFREGRYGHAQNQRPT